MKGKLQREMVNLALLFAETPRTRRRGDWSACGTAKLGLFEVWLAMERSLEAGDWGDFDGVVVRRKARVLRSGCI